MLPEIQSKVVLIKAMRVRVFVLKPVWSFCFFECCFLFRLLLLLHFPSGASSPVVSSIKREDGDRQQRKVHERSSQPNGVKVGQRYGTRWREERANLSLLYVHLFLRSPTPDPAVGPVPNATLFPLLNFLVFFFCSSNAIKTLDEFPPQTEAGCSGFCPGSTLPNGDVIRRPTVATKRGISTHRAEKK